MFDKTKTIDTAPKKAAKPAAPTATIVGVFAYTCLDTVISALNGLKDVYEKKIKDSAIQHWIKEGMSAKARPANFKGAEGSARTQLDLKQRPSNSPVTGDDIDQCEKAGIPLFDNVKQIGAWVINPEIVADQEKMDTMAKALKKLPFAADLFMWQEEVTCKVVKESTIDAIFKLDDPKEVEKFIRMLCVVSAKPTQESTDDAFKHVSKMTGEAISLAVMAKNQEKTQPKTVQRAVKVRAESGAEA